MITLFFLYTGMTSCKKDPGELIESKKEAAGTSPNKKDVTNTSVNYSESSCDGGDDEDPEPMIYGHVSNGSKRLAGACVALMSGSDVVATSGTDLSGHYYFNAATNGTYDIRVIAPGYTVKYTQVIITNQVPDEANIVVSPY